MFKENLFRKGKGEISLDRTIAQLIFMFWGILFTDSLQSRVSLGEKILGLGQNIFSGDTSPYKFK